MHIALLDDELNDGGRGDRIETAGGRIVEHQLRVVDEERVRWPRVASYRLKGLQETYESLFQADKSERLVDAAVDLFVGHCLLDQLIGDVVAHGERIKERAFLKDHSGARSARGTASLPACERCLRRTARRRPFRGRSSPMMSLRSTLLPTPAGPSRMRVSRGRHGKADVLKNRRAIEAQWTRRASRRRDPVRRPEPGRKRCGDSVAHVGKRREQHVRDKKIHRNDEHGRVDHRRIVERPTPSVPPVVLMP